MAESDGFYSLPPIRADFAQAIALHLEGALVAFDSTYYQYGGLLYSLDHAVERHAFLRQLATELAYYFQHASFLTEELQTTTVFYSDTVGPIAIALKSSIEEMPQDKAGSPYI